MTVVAGKLRAVLEAEVATFSRDLRKARADLSTAAARMKQDIDGFRRRVSLAGKQMAQFRNLILSTAGMGGLGYLVRQSIDAADAIGKTADKIGLSTASLQELRFAAGQASVSQATLDMAMQRFSRRLAQAAQGKGELVGVLKQYNIAVRDADGRTRGLDAVLGDLAEAIRTAGSDQERLRIAFKAFDSEGAALVNMLKNGAAGLEAMRQRARDMGVVLDEHLIRNAEEASSQLDLLTRIISAQLAAAVVSLAPDIVDLADAMLESGDAADDMRSSSAGLAETLVFLAGSVKVVWNLLQILFRGMNSGMRMLGSLMTFNFAEYQREAARWRKQFMEDLADLDRAGARMFPGVSSGGTALNLKGVRHQVGGRDQPTPAPGRTGGGKAAAESEADAWEAATRRVIEAWRAQAEAERSISEEMYRELGVGAREHYQREVDQLLAKVARWREAGADIRRINQYLYDELGKMAEEAWGKGEEASARYLESLQYQQKIGGRLIDEFERLHAMAARRLDDLGVRLDDLDGRDIQISFSVHDRASGTIGALISRLEALRASIPQAAPVPAPRPGVPATGSAVVVNNFNQQISRSDILSITAEQRRMEARGG